MELKIYDNVELNMELEELAEKGIHKGETGVVFEIKADICYVLFLNSKNYGDYAYVKINKKYLDFCDFHYGKNVKDFERFKATGDLTKDRFKPQKFIEYDAVELIVEKEKYAKYGVHKGAQGTVMENYCIDSDYYVIFTDETTAEDIADISVHEDDLKLVWRNPKNTVN